MHVGFRQPLPHHELVHLSLLITLWLPALLLLFQLLFRVRLCAVGSGRCAAVLP